MKAAKLINVCQNCLTEYQTVARNQPINLFADEFLTKTLGDKACNEGEFIRQVLYGVNRYSGLIKGALGAMSSVKGLISPQEATLYSIIIYIAVLRLSELPIKEFRRLVISQDAEKMYNLLSYLFIEDSQEALAAAWCAEYEEMFVRDSLLGPMQESVPDVETLCEELLAKVGPSSSTIDLAKTEALKPKATEVKPFNLTKPKPRIVPEPDVLPGVGFKARPVPEMSKQGKLEDTKEYQELVVARAENREKEKEMYSDPKVQRFVMETEARPTNLATLQEEAELKMQEETTTDFKAQPAPKPAKKPATVRMTATSIMREDALYKKKQAEEKAIIENYENNLRDGSEFYEWQAEMKAKDEALLQYQVNQRRREMAESAINAIEAKDKDLAHKKAVADEMKVESHQMQQKLKEEAEQRRLYNQQIASDVRDIEEYARISVQAAYEKRVENARAVKEEREEIEKKVAEQMELERQRKADQVQLMRAAEEVSKQKKINAVADRFDPTTTAAGDTGGGAFLGEMSFIEMKERKLLNESKEKSLTEQRRVRIIETKLDKVPSKLIL